MKNLRFKELIKNHVPLDLSAQYSDFACVSLIIVNQNGKLELGFIQRAFNSIDPWSGQVAFPGGRKESYETDFDGAIRETVEEIGIELNSLSFVGRLDDIQARKKQGLIPFFIRPFVFYLNEKPQEIIDPTEVHRFFWYPIEKLNDEKFKTQVKMQHDGHDYELPALKLEIEPSLDTPLWGLTFMMTSQLLSFFNLSS